MRALLLCNLIVTASSSLNRRVREARNIVVVDRGLQGVAVGTVAVFENDTIIPCYSRSNKHLGPQYAKGTLSARVANSFNFNSA
jgi:hypothetical protein